MFLGIHHVFTGLPASARTTTARTAAAKSSKATSTAESATTSAPTTAASVPTTPGQKHPEKYAAKRSEKNNQYNDDQQQHTACRYSRTGALHSLRWRRVS